MFSRFQKACIKYGVPDVDLFQSVDLFEQKNIYRVTMTIFAIGRTVRYNIRIARTAAAASGSISIASTTLGFRRTSTRSGEVLRWDRGRPRRTGAIGPKHNCGPAKASSGCKPDRTRGPRKPDRTSAPPERYCWENERARTTRFRYL